MINIDITNNARKHRMDWNGCPIFQPALSLLVLLVAIYSLTYSGTFVTDDEHILSSRTLSLAFDKNISDSRVYGNSRVFALSTLPDVSATQSLNIEPGQEIAGAMLAHLAVFLHVGQIQSLFQLNIGVTALTAVALFGVVLILGHSLPAAFALSLLFGLGTLAWPYARTYFRDPLAMLFLTWAWACAQMIKNKNPPFQAKQNYWLIWAGLIVFLAAGIFTKNVITIAVPVILADILINSRKFITDNCFSIISLLKRNWKKLLILIGSLFFLLIIWILVLPRLELFARFTPNYYNFLINFFFNSPHPKFFEALTGPFVSPGKSIFLYSPILVLAIIGLVRFPKSAWPAWLYLFLLVIGQALFYDKDWWGNINWGLRFTLPAIPPLMIASAPVVESWLRTARGRLGLVSLGSISVLVQIIGVLPPIRNYYTKISTASPAVSEFVTLWVPKYSALLWNLKWILSGGKLELAAVRIGAPAIPIVLGFGVIIFLILLGLKRITWRWFPLTAFILTIGLMIFMLVAYKRDPAYYQTRTDLQAVQEKISRGYLPGDLVLIKSYGTPAWYFMMDWGNPQLQWTSLPFYFPAPSLIERSKLTHDPELALDEITLSLLRKVPGSYQRVWLVLPGDSPGADLNLEVDWLGNKSLSTSSWVFLGDRVETRLYLFEINPGLNP
jgi:hypothetical protein